MEKIMQGSNKHMVLLRTYPNASIYADNIVIVPPPSTGRSVQEAAIEDSGEKDE